MRIFGKFEFGYEGSNLCAISLTPFNEDCYYVDLDGEDTCETYIEGIEDSSWKPYNWEGSEYYYYYPKFDEYVTEDDSCEDEKYEDEDYLDAEKITVYKEGKLIKEYFTHD